MFSTCSTSHPTKELSQCSLVFTDALAFRYGSGPDRTLELRKIKIQLVRENNRFGSDFLVGVGYGQTDLPDPDPILHIASLYCSALALFKETF